MLLPLIDYERLFYSDPDAQCIPYGMQTFTHKKQAETFMDEIYMQDYSGGVELVAKCDCGHLTGNYYMGLACDKCETLVRDVMSSEIKIKSWLELPKYMPKILHPGAYWVLKKWLGTIKSRSRLDLLMDRNAIGLVDEHLATRCGCGFNNFVTKFDEIMDYLLDEYPPMQTTKGKERSTNIREFITQYRDVMFMNHLPVLNSNLHLMTSSGSMRYVDVTSSNIIKVIIELSSLEFKNSTNAKTPMFIDQQAFSIQKAFCDYIQSIIDKKLRGKKGYFRRHMVGSRIHCTSRAVIIPIVGEHRSDEVYLPWRIGISMYELEIHNILTNRRGFSIQDSLAKLSRAISSYDKDIDEALCTLIKECPFIGVPITAGRNPTMRHGAIMLLYCTKFKTDLSDDCFALSSLVLTPSNADLKVA